MWEDNNKRKIYLYQRITNVKIAWIIFKKILNKLKMKVKQNEKLEELNIYEKITYADIQKGKSV